MLGVTSEASMVDAVGRRGAVSVREHAEVPVVHVGLETLKVNPMAREGYALEQQDVLGFSVRFVVHDGDVEETEVKGLWGRMMGGRSCLQPSFQDVEFFRIRDDGRFLFAVIANESGLVAIQTESKRSDPRTGDGRFRMQRRVSASCRMSLP